MAPHTKKTKKRQASKRRPRGLSAQSAYIKQLKTDGLNLLSAIKEVRARFGIDLGEAKQLVTSHPAWREIATANAGLQTQFVDVFSASASGRPH